MSKSNLIAAKKLFYSKNYESALSIFTQEKQYYESGLCSLLLKRTQDAYKFWKKVKNQDPAANFGIIILDYLNLKPKKIPSFFQTRAQLEVYLNLFIENDLIQWAENIISCCEYFNKANPESYKFIARALFSNRYFDLAIEFCKKSLKLYYTDCECLLILAQTYFITGNIGEALDITNKILRIDSNYYPAQLFKEILFEEINKKHNIS